MADGNSSLRKRSRRSLNQSLDETVSSSTDVIYSDKITPSGLLRVEWKAYHTSLILEKGRSELNHAKCLAITKMISKDCKDHKKIDVILTRCPGIALNDTSPEAVLVEVSFSDEMVYVGYFLNWSAINEGIDEFEKLPILLVKGKTEITRIVNAALVKAFDFVITPIFLNSLQLACLFAQFVSCADNEDEKSASLKYSVPGVPKKSFITVSVRVKDLCVILDFYDSVLDDEQDPVPILFHEKILDHFRKSYQLDLARAELRQVTLPEAMATDKGTFQAKTEDVLSAALKAFHTFFAKTGPPPAPPTSFTADS